MIDKLLTDAELLKWKWPCGKMGRGNHTVTIWNLGKWGNHFIKGYYGMWISISMHCG